MEHFKGILFHNFGSANKQHTYESINQYQKIWLIKICLDGIQSKVRIINYLSSSFLTENSLKQGGASSPLLFNFAPEYAFKKVQGTNLGLNINCTH